MSEAVLKLSERWGRKYSQSHDLWADIDATIEAELAKLRTELEVAKRFGDSQRVLKEQNINRWVESQERLAKIEKVLVEITGRPADSFANIESLRAERDALSEQLEVDRTAVADCITKAKKELTSRAWMATGRGSYEWDDDKYQEEFGAALEAIGSALDPLTKIAADWTGCPKTSAEIAQARIDLKQERDALQVELEAAQGQYRSLKVAFDMLYEGTEREHKQHDRLLILCEKIRDAIELSSGVLHEEEYLDLLQRANEVLGEVRE